MATVGLLGIPIERRRGSFYATPKGATDQLRKDIEQLLAESGSKLTVVDVGELLLPVNNTFDIYCRQLGTLAKEAIGSSKADVMLAVGGNHVSALPLYHLPGHVVRADAHGDAYVGNPPPKRCSADGSTYVFCAVQERLKSEQEVWNVGVNQFSQPCYNRGVVGRCFGIDQILAVGEIPARVIVDIDVDVLGQGDCEIACTPFTSDLTPQDLAGIIAKFKPYVVGVFECVDTYGAIPKGIVSAHQNVFKPICKAVAEAAVARSIAVAAVAANQQTPQASSATYR